MTWEAEFVGGPLDGAVRTFPGPEPRLLAANVVVQLRHQPPVDWSAEMVPELVWVRYRAEVCMDLGRPAWRLVLER